MTTRHRTVLRGRRAIAVLALAALVAVGAPATTHPSAGAAVIPPIGHDHDSDVDFIDPPTEGFSTVTAGEDARSVERLYLAYFLRTPDPDGLRHWTRVRASGVSLARISDEFARSREFQSRYGALDDPGFVDLVYRNVLGRPADPAGRAHWIAHLDRGVPRGQIMIGFSDSIEFKRATTHAPVVPALPPAPSVPAGTVKGRDWVVLYENADGTPVRWDPCAPIRVAANFTAAQPGAETALRRAVDLVARGSALKISFVGTTTARANDEMASVQESIRDPNAEVVVSWPAVWKTDAAGRGGSARRVPPGGPATYVWGGVQIRASGAWNTTQLTHLFAHELGHVLGLGHPPVPGHVMSQGGQMALTAFTPGDLTGLRHVGAHGVRCPT